MLRHAITCFLITTCLLSTVTTLTAQELKLLLCDSQWDYTEWYKQKKAPCCVSGLEWSQKDSLLYFVSDIEKAIYTCSLKVECEHSPTDTIYRFKMSQPTKLPIPEKYLSKGLEAIRINSSGDIALSIEKENSDDEVESYVMKGTIEGNKLIVKRLPLPASFRNKTFWRNAGIEGIAFSIGTPALWIINEKAFYQKPVDRTKLSLATTDFTVTESQHLNYVLDTAEQAVSEILFLNDDQLLAIERFHIDSVDSVYANIVLTTINEGKLTRKTLFSFNTRTNPNYVENYEGMCLGPMVNNHRTLIVVSDNNEKREKQETQLLLFEIIEDNPVQQKSQDTTEASRP